MRKRHRFAAKRKALFSRSGAILLTMILVLLLVSQPAFASNTYVITDGSRVITYTTTETDPETILDEAGLTLGEDDTFTQISRLGSSEITVRRSQTVTLSLYGGEMTVTSHGETVAELLARLNIVPEEGDILSHSLSDYTFDNMLLRIDKIVTEQQVYTATVSHGISYGYDASLPEGTEVVLTEGVDGEMRYVADVTYINGQEAEREILSRYMTIPPVEEVVALGTGLSTGSAEDLIIEDGRITLPTGEVLTYTQALFAGATAYYNRGTTATGTQAREGVVAVDPRWVPFGTRMFIVTNDGEYIYGIGTAEDAGDQNIKYNRIDLWYPTLEECVQFGYRECTVYILGSE